MKLYINRLFLLYVFNLIDLDELIIWRIIILIWIRSLWIGLFCWNWMLIFFDYFNNFRLFKWYFLFKGDY